eukprot:symbB.v1.2.017645.t1/scaffold1373.1/size231899/10
MSYCPSGPPESRHRDIWISGKVGGTHTRCLATSLHQKGYEVTLVDVKASSETPLASWGEVTLEEPRKGRNAAVGSLDTIKKARA